jgi:transposase, putative, N-terminal domain
MITLQCQLEFQNKQDKEIALDLMRKFSSAMRYAYRRLLEGNKRKDLKKDLSKLFNINTLQKHLESGKSETASQQPVNQWKEQVRGLPMGGHKSWQVLSIALAFCCLERSCRDFSPLKQIIVLGDWTAVANRLVPVLGAGTMTLPKYRLLGSEVSEMAEYKYPNPSCSFVQFG